MRVAAPHIGVEPCAGAKTDVMGFPRVVVECLLALAQHTRGRTAIEIVNLHEVGKAVAGEPPRALHADGPADTGNKVLQFWIPPGRCITWEMGGSQFTMTLWMGLSQTPENDNGNGSHSRFPGFATIPCTGSWRTGTPPFPRLYTCLVQSETVSPL